jgi:hypothetical protein
LFFRGLQTAGLDEQIVAGLEPSEVWGAPRPQGNPSIRRTSQKRGSPAGLGVVTSPLLIFSVHYFHGWRLRKTEAQKNSLPISLD